MVSSPVLEILASARRVATHAERLGVVAHALPTRPTLDHIGAVLADCVLQAGLNYRTVVRPRVNRIRIAYPDSARLSGVKGIIGEGRAAEFLCWKHPAKLSRFVSLVELLDGEDVERTTDLRGWLRYARARDRLLCIPGVGPKTFDYLCCLVGLDRIAVDRHVKSFADEAGVSLSSYDELQTVTSYAADLLGLSRRDFDAWIWSIQARQSHGAEQMELF